MKFIPPLNALPGDEQNEDRAHWNADPSGSSLALRQGSFPDAEGFEAVQREIVNVIAEAGLDPDAEDLTQLKQAVIKMISDKLAGDAAVDKKGLVELATLQEGYDTNIQDKVLRPYNFVNNTFGPRGYQKMPGGLIIQWGSFVINGGGTTGGGTWPITWPNAVFQAAYSIRQSSAAAYQVGMYPLSNTSISFRNQYNGSVEVGFIGVGY